MLESNYMQPGYRSDVLVVFPSEGDYCLLNQAAPRRARVQGGNGGGQGPTTPQLLAYVHVRGGQPVTGDLRAYVGKALYDANPRCRTPFAPGLRDGDLRPWAPFEDLAPPGVGGQQQQADFAINFPAFTVKASRTIPTW